MQNEKLSAFVTASKSKGASDDFLATLLLRRGWSREDVFGAIGAYWETCTGVAVPERAGRGESARDGFLYLLAFLTLSVWSSALGSMVFEFIDHWFPDPVAVAWRDPRVSVTWQMASVAVAFPIFAMVMRIILGEATQSPERLESGVRRWLTLRRSPKSGSSALLMQSTIENNPDVECFNLWGQWHLPQAIRNPSFPTPVF